MKKILTTALAFCLIAGFATAGPFVTTNAEAKATTKKSKQSLTEEEANATLHTFALNALEKMNRLVIPSKNKKELKKNSNGTWTARYTEIDVNSIQTSVAIPADTKFVDYVGYMRYTDVEYICTADSKETALNGPFKVNSKESLTELVKCMKGKWGY